MAAPDIISTRPISRRIDNPIDRRRFLAATSAGAATMLASAYPRNVGAQTMTIDFRAAAIGGLPEGFIFARTGNGAAGGWSVLEDTSAPSKRVLAQTIADPTDYRFPMAIHEKISAANVEATVRFKAVAGRVDRAGGLVVRLADADNYYVVRANALEDNVNFYRVVNGGRREIKGVAMAVPSGVWHELSLKAVGDSFTIAFNGRALFTATDRTFAAAGKVALWTKADSVTHFDGLMVKMLA